MWIGLVLVLVRVFIRLRSGNMVDEELLYECCKKKVSELNRKIVELECENFALEKENERLERRINLIEYRPMPCHCNKDGDSSFFDKYSNLDCYTLEKLYLRLDRVIKIEENKAINNIQYICGMQSVRSWLWGLMDSDSHDWLTKSKEEYYGCDDE